MANVTFKDPLDNCLSNSSITHTIANENNNSLKTMSFYRDTSEKWLYVNYPETITNNLQCFANNDKGNKCLLQETISANKTAQIFFSHHNGCSYNINYAVLLFNPNSYDITVTVPNYGYARGWNVAEFQPWSQFFDSAYARTIIVPKNSTKWLVDQRNIPPNAEPFSGNIRFSSSGSVIITACLWTGSDTTVIDGTETVYPYNINDSSQNKVYTGIGEGFFLSTSNTVTSTDLLYGKKIYYSLTSCSGSNTNEIIPINLAGTNYTAKKGAASPLNNLGNWCAQYAMSFTLKNTTSMSKTFRCYLGRCGAEGKIVVNYNGVTKYCSMGLNTSTQGTAYKWNFIDVELSAGETYDLSFQFIHATCSNAPIYLQWEEV